MQISFALGWGKVVKRRLFKDFNPAARSFPPSRLGSPNKFDCSRLVVG